MPFKIERFSIQCRQLGIDITHEEKNCKKFGEAQQSKFQKCYQSNVKVLQCAL